MNREICSNNIFLLELKNVSSYVLLLNIYIELRSRGYVQRVMILIKDRGMKKTLACSWVEVDKRLYVLL